MAELQMFFERNWARLQQAALFHPSGNVTLGNPDFTKADVRVLVVRLSPFSDVERSTPHLFLFQAVRRVLPAAFIDFAFFPPRYDRERFLTHNIPLLVGTQSWREAGDFDLILISNAYTLELINLPYVLMNSGIPVMASERGETHPPLILGGSNALATQAIIKHVTSGTGDAILDSIVDAIFFGEGEREVEKLVHSLYEHRSLPKSERLRFMATQITGLWIAGQPEGTRVTHARCAHPQAEDMLQKVPILNGEEADVARMQITYGCPAFCSFCFEGYDRKPYRELSLEDVWTTALILKKETGPATLDLVSFNFNTYADIAPLLVKLSRLYYRVSYKSQRVDLLTAMPELLDVEIIAGKRSYTVGIEGISQRMRVFLHKSLNAREIESLVSRLLHYKVREIKLFYILTGYEKPDDIDEFRLFLRDLKSDRSGTRRGTRIVFSFGLLIRMPFTPLRYDRLFLDESDWQDVIGQVKSACETNSFEFRLAMSWADYAVSQVLALGGTWLSDFLVTMAHKGYCYDTELAEDYWHTLRSWMESEGYWTADFLGEKDADTAFPLAFVRHSVSPDFLYHQYRQAQEGVDGGYCLGEIGHMHDESADARCLGCGACTTREERLSITTHRMTRVGGDDVRALEALMAEKQQIKPRYVQLWCPPGTAGKTSAWVNAWVMRTVLNAIPSQLENLLLVKESLFGTKENSRRYAGLYGETVFALYAWDTDVLKDTLMENATALAELRFIRWLDDFTPGAFERATLTLVLPTRHFPEAGHQLRRYLQEQYVPVNLRRTDGGYLFDVPKKALQKRMLYAGQFSQDDACFQCEITVSPKFDLKGYLQSFDDPYWAEEARVEVSALTF